MQPTNTAAQPALDTNAALALQAFALAHLSDLENGMAFVHMVTQAVGGDPWAAEQVTIAINDIAYMTRMATEQVEALKAQVASWHKPHLRVDADAIKLDVIRNAETTRPDGAIARSFQV